jgi:TP901 family phage tail tape measure protein
MSDDLKFALQLTWEGSAASAGLASFAKEWAEFRKLVGGAEADFRAARETISKTTLESRKFAGAMELGGTKVQQFNRDVINLNRDAMLLDNRLIESRNHVRNFGDSASQAARELGRVSSEMRAADRAVQNIEYHFHGATNAIAGTRREIGLLKGSMSDLQKLSMLAGGVGLGYGAFTQIRTSARLDQRLTSIMQTGDATAAQRERLRPELFGLARQTGRPVEDIADVMDFLVQTGLTWDQALAGTRATVPAMAVTKADGRSLAQSLVTASNLYGFDLTKPGVAGNVMDLMRAGGKAGAAEMENLSQVLPIFAPSARRAGMDFKESLAYIETLSNIVAQPHKLGTLADATLRVWNQKAYTDQVTGLTGVKFFDDKGAYRPKGDVITDIIKFAAKRGGTDKQMHDLLGMIFKGMDEEGVRGFSMLIQDPKKIARMDEINKYMDQAPGMLSRELPEAINNAVDQSARLGAALRKVADDFSRPINKTLADLIEFGMKSKSEGGLEMSNGELLGAGAALAVGGAALFRGGAGLFRRLPGAFKKFPGVGGVVDTAAGVVEGKTIEKMAGVTPVFVVNMPGGGFGGGSGGGLASAAEGAAAATVAPRVLKAMKAMKSLRLSSILGFGLEGVEAASPAGLLGPGAAALAGLGAGSYLYSKIETSDFADKLGGAIAQALAKLGDGTAQAAIDRRLDPPVKAELKIHVGHDGRPKVQSLKSDSPAFAIDVYRGPMMAYP